MKMGKRIVLATFIALLSVALIGGCASKTVKDEISEKPTKAAKKPGIVKGLEEEVIKDEGALVERGPVEVSLAELENELSRMVEEEGRLTPIYFDFDRFSIKEDAKPVLNMIAKWLKKNKEISIRIQGHADERGSNEYNIALGERRAQSTRNYLTTFGIRPSRLSTISFGEEMPADSGRSEEAWAKNRRSEFEVISR
jgi:peptidoglycan-associated lipoprotein